MSAVLGIDGGGTRTRASIVDGANVLAFVENGSIKRLRVGAVTAEENLRTILKEVFFKAGVKDVKAASAGVASATMPGVKDWITGVFSSEATIVCLQRNPCKTRSFSRLFKTRKRSPARHRPDR